MAEREARRALADLLGRWGDPVLGVLLALGGALEVSTTAPGFMGKSVVLVAVFMITLYSVGANATGVGGWLGGLAVLASVAALDLQDGDDNPRADPATRRHPLQPPVTYSGH